MKKHINACETLKEEIHQHLREFNAPFKDIQEEIDLVFDERDEKGTLVGGLVCRIVGQWLEIDYLWVESSHRHQGLGSKLLQAAEDEAREYKCKKVILSTFSFQAQPFYEKHGYEVVLVLKDYPIINSKTTMIKTF